MASALDTVVHLVGAALAGKEGSLGQGGSLGAVRGDLGPGRKDGSLCCSSSPLEPRRG